MGRRGIIHRAYSQIRHTLLHGKINLVNAEMHNCIYNKQQANIVRAERLNLHTAHLIHG